MTKGPKTDILHIQIMQFYEINILTSPELSQEEVSSFVAAMENQLQGLGKLVGETKTERKRLAYPIKDEEEAWFSFFSFFPKQDENLKEALDLIDKKLKEEKKILRHFIVKRDERKAEARKEARHRKEKEPEKEATAHLTEVEMKEVEEKINELLEEN